MCNLNTLSLRFLISSMEYSHLLLRVGVRVKDVHTAWSMKGTPVPCPLHLSPLLLYSALTQAGFITTPSCSCPDRSAGQRRAAQGSAGLECWRLWLGALGWGLPHPRLSGRGQLPLWCGLAVDCWLSSWRGGRHRRGLEPGGARWEGEGRSVSGCRAPGPRWIRGHSPIPGHRAARRTAAVTPAPPVGPSCPRPTLSFC